MSAPRDPSPPFGPPRLGEYLLNVNIVLAGFPYTMSDGDFLVATNRTAAGAITVKLGTPWDGRICGVKDYKGDAGANNVTVDGNGVNIEGAATEVISTNRAERWYRYDAVAAEWKKIWAGASGAMVAAAHASTHLSGGADDLFAANAANTFSFPTAVVDGAGAIGVKFNNTVALANATARLASWQNAGVEKAAILKNGELLAPSIGPATGQQHTLPAVTSGTLLVSGAASITDNTLSLGDATHRLVNLGIKTLLPGASPLTITSAVADGAGAKAAVINSGSAWANATAALLELQNNGVAKAQVFQDGSATFLGDVTTTALKTSTALTTGAGGDQTPAFGANFAHAGAGNPTTAAQNGWLLAKDSTGAVIWIPVWK